MSNHTKFRNKLTHTHTRPCPQVTRSLTLAPSQGATPCNPHRSAEPLRYVVCTQLHYVALLHSKRCLSVTASQTGFFVGWRIPKPTEKKYPLGPPRLTISSRDGPRGERSNLICRLPPEKPLRRFYENRKREFGSGVSFVY